MRYEQMVQDYSKRDKSRVINNGYSSIVSIIREIGDKGTGSPLIYW